MRLYRSLAEAQPASAAELYRLAALNIRRELLDLAKHYYGPRGLGTTLAGLCDAGEVDDFRRGLERAGLGSDLSPEDMERLGFYVCHADLEDELIRAVGAGAVEAVLATQGLAASKQILVWQGHIATAVCAPPRAMLTPAQQSEFRARLATTAIADTLVR